MCGVALGKASLVADRIQILPSIAENGYDHGYFRDDLVQNPRPGADDSIVNNPQRRINKHPHEADLLRTVRIPADRRRNIRGHRQNRPPAVPGENQRRHLHDAQRGAHGFPFQKAAPASQTKGANRVQNIADPAGDRAQHQQMGGVAQIGNKLDAEQRPVAFALVRQEKQNRPEKADRLYENGFSRHGVSLPSGIFLVNLSALGIGFLGFIQAHNICPTAKIRFFIL